MTITRRLLLKLSLISGVAAILPIHLLLRSYQANLEALIDTLIPDADNSSAAEQLLKQFLQDYKQARIYQQGLAWLDRQAKTTFNDSFNLLSREQRDLLLTQADQTTRGSIPYRFLYRARKDALEMFYGSSQGWDVVGYYGPPQPLGYPDHHLPPKQPQP